MTYADLSSSTADAVAVLAERDPALPDLGLILDPERLATALGRDIAIERVRYKRGAAVVVAVRGEDDTRAWVAEYSDPAKLEKTEARARRAGHTVARVTPAALTGTAEADRVLSPVLHRLSESRAELLADARVVRYNPHRRLVLRAGGLAVKVRDRDADLADDVARSLAASGHPVIAPVRLGDRVSATEWWGSGDLSTRHDPERERRAGGILAALHAVDPSAFPVVPHPPVVGASRAAAAVAAVLPDLSARADRLALRIAERLGGSASAVLLHGDWSLDQVLSDGRAVRIIDLDRVTTGPAERDLGSALASGATTALLEGYAAAGGAVDESTLPAWTALSLLQRAIDPFRALAAGWPSAVRDRLAQAEGGLS